MPINDSIAKLFELENITLEDINTTSFEAHIFFETHDSYLSYL